MAYTIVLAAAAALSACGSEYWHKFQFGTISPNFRFEVELPSDVSKTAILRKANLVLREYGYGEPGDPIFDGMRRGRIWPNRENKDPGEAEVSILFENGERFEATAQALIVISFSGTRGLDTDDWLLFDKWQTEIVPKIFPYAEVRVVRHPAKYTDPKELGRIESETGVKTPKEHLPE